MSQPPDLYGRGFAEKAHSPVPLPLNPGGFLFLGTSETIGDSGNLFAVLDRKLKLYQRKGDVYSAQRAGLGRFLPPLTMLPETTQSLEKKTGIKKLPLRELTEQAILQQVAPIGALVNSHGDILYLQGRTGEYLELAPGVAGTSNILKMAREGLQYDLTIALHKAAGTKEIVRHPDLRVKTNGDFTTVNLTIRPVAPEPAATPEAFLYLVLLEKAPPFDREQARTDAAMQTGKAVEGQDTLDLDSRITSLKQELKAKEEYLQTTKEELETSNEELKSSNEEMQSVNEELQSTNEELETSKEELQSVNEELATVNAELQTKVTDLSRANNDMNNLLAGTGIATIFVDHQQQILSFTPAATQIINLIMSDVGRPLGHIVSNLLGYDHMAADVQGVLDSLIPKKLELQTKNGAWYKMNIMPYRTRDNVIEGAVITFVDITEMKETQDKLRKANDLTRLAVVVHDAYDAIILQDLDGRILAWNPGAVRQYGWSESEAMEMNICSLIPKEHQEGALATIRRLSRAETLEPYHTQRITKDGTVLEIWMTSTALMDETGHMYAIATTERQTGIKNKSNGENHNER